MGRNMQLLVSSGLGAGIISITMLLFGLVGLWDTKIIRTGFIAGVLIYAGAILYRRWSQGKTGENKRLDNIVFPDAKRLDVLQYAALILITIAAVTNLLATSGPAILYDALIYHLALPKLYLLHGRIISTPENLYSGIPFNMEMLYGLTLAISTEKLAALLHCVFGMATALAIWAFMRRHVSNAAGILAALMFYLCPIVLFGSWQAGIDLGAAFYIVMAFITLSLGLDSEEASEATGWSVVTGIFVGLALGVKYTLFPLGATVVLVHLYSNIREGRPAGKTVWLVVPAFAILAPWLSKNVAFYGNPVYPFLHKLFGSHAPAEWLAFLSDARAHNPVQILTTLAGIKSFFIVPWNISVVNQVIGDSLGAVYLALIPLAFTMRWGVFRGGQSVPGIRAMVVIFALAGWMTWHLTSALLRFLVPVLPFVSFAFALAVESRGVPAFLRKTGWAVAIILSMYNFQEIFVMGGAKSTGNWDAISSGKPSSDYLKSQHLTYGLPYYAAMEYINSKLPPDAKVLFLGESRAFYCERKFIAATVFDNNPFWLLARKSKTAAELHAGLKAMNVTHIFLNAPQLYVYSALSTIIPRDVYSWPVFNEFWARYLRLVYEKRTGVGGIEEWLLVYELIDTPNDTPDKYAMNPFPSTIKTLQVEGRW